MEYKDIEKLIDEMSEFWQKALLERILRTEEIQKKYNISKEDMDFLTRSFFKNDDD